MKFKLFLAAILLTAYTLPAYALRCGGKLVNTGDHTTRVAKILKACGKISKTTSYVEHITSQWHHGVKKRN